MSALPFVFTSPYILFGLLALPAIWWLLRLTPPRPKAEVFPPLKILATVLKREETPSKSPWWLTLLRMALAAAVIFALADPVVNPRNSSIAGSGPWCSWSIIAGPPRPTGSGAWQPLKL